VVGIIVQESPHFPTQSQAPTTLNAGTLLALANWFLRFRPDLRYDGGMAWKPISKAYLLGHIEVAEYEMTPVELALWSNIRTRPIKWQLPPWGDMGGGFWVVAVFGQQCIWFNDIEDGFNVSNYLHFGTIGSYECSQSELQDCVRSNFASVLASSS
jgi:hypothetical protein